MKHKLKTWTRIKWRMFLIFLSEIYLFAEIPLIVAFNWLMFLTIPLWVGPAYMLMMIGNALNKDSKERQVLTGQIWFWDQFRRF